MRAYSSHAIRSWIAFFIFAALVIPGGGLAQNAQQPINPRSAPAPPPPPPQASPNEKGTIRTAVELVQVDVEVTDRDGKPIKGLRQNQFSVSEDGKGSEDFDLRLL